MGELAFDPEPDNTRLLAVGLTAEGAAGIETWTPAGEVSERYGPGGYTVSPPRELPPGHLEELQRAFPAHLQAATDVPALLRAVGWLFASTAALTDGISGQVDLGLILPGREPLKAQTIRAADLIRLGALQEATA